MRFGVCYNVDYREDVHGSPSDYFSQIMEQVDLLEALGYDSAWFSEHHCAAYSFGNPSVVAAAAAARTSRLKIGTGVSLIPLHHPIFLAEQYGLLDVLSNGRLEYGVGRGYLMHEYDWLKIPAKESHGRYREGMEFILKAWQSEGKPMDFHGEFYDVDGYTYFPKPVQQPYPAIYASAGGTVESFRWAGEKGFHLGTALFLPDLSELAGNIDLYRRSLVENGHDPATREIMAITQMYCASDREEALRDGAAYAEGYYRFFAELSALTAPDNPVSQYFRTADARQMNADGKLVLGDPEMVIERIHWLRETYGLDFLLMEVAQGGAPHEKILATLELFAKEVMPHFTGASADRPKVGSVTAA